MPNKTPQSQQHLTCTHLGSDTQALDSHLNDRITHLSRGDGKSEAVPQMSESTHFQVRAAGQTPLQKWWRRSLGRCRGRARHSHGAVPRAGDDLREYIDLLPISRVAMASWEEACQAGPKDVEDIPRVPPIQPKEIKEKKIRDKISSNKEERGSVTLTATARKSSRTQGSTYRARGNGSPSTSRWRQPSWMRYFSAARDG